jgi:hypothetical protein
MNKPYEKPKAIQRGTTKHLIVAAIHKGCPSSGGRTKKG